MICWVDLPSSSMLEMCEELLTFLLHVKKLMEQIAWNGPLLHQNTLKNMFDIPVTLVGIWKVLLPQKFH